MFNDGSSIYSDPRSRVPEKEKTVGTSWRMDETYIKVKGKWHYLDQADSNAPKEAIGNAGYLNAKFSENLLLRWQHILKVE